jgi:hypothetical protein
MLYVLLPVLPVKVQGEVLGESVVGMGVADSS